MSALDVEDSLGLSATVANRVFAASASEYQVQINATTRIVLRGSFGTAALPPYTVSYDAPQLGAISSVEVWRTSNGTPTAAVLGKAFVTGAMARLETLFEDAIMPADAVRSAIPRNFAVPSAAVHVHAGGASYFDIAQTDGTYLRFLGSNLAYDPQGFPVQDQGTVFGVVELDAAKHALSAGYTSFVAPGLGQISVTPGQVYMGLFDTVLINAVYAQMFDGNELTLTRTGSLAGAAFPFAGFFNAQVISGDAATNHLDGYFGNDRLLGLAAADVLKGRVGNDTLDGGSGNDLIYGGAGADSLLGGTGSDRISGGSSADRIIGGAGRDVLWGGSGADRFVFGAASDSGTGVTTRDSIADFSRVQGDKIDLSAIDAVPGGINQAFKLDAGGGFAVGELRIVVSGVDRIVQVNLDADTAAEMTILLQHPAIFGVGDIIL